MADADMSMKELLRSRRFQAGVSIVLGVGLLAYFLSRVPLADIGRRIAQASPSWLARERSSSLC